MLGPRSGDVTTGQGGVERCWGFRQRSRDVRDRVQGNRPQQRAERAQIGDSPAKALSQPPSCSTRCNQWPMSFRSCRAMLWLNGDTLARSRPDRAGRGARRHWPWRRPKASSRIPLATTPASPRYVDHEHPHFHRIADRPAHVRPRRRPGSTHGVRRVQPE